jgi:hypothetical protein
MTCIKNLLACYAFFLSTGRRGEAEMHTLRYSGSGSGGCAQAF